MHSNLSRPPSLWFEDYSQYPNRSGWEGRNGAKREWTLVSTLQNNILSPTV
jgi:hypothetical protein